MSLTKILETAFEYAKVTPETRLRLSYPERTIRIMIPMRHDDGTLKMYKSWRCQHSSIYVMKGGLRFSENLTKEHTETLAALMTYKCAVLQIPFTGSKGGIAVDPSKLTNREIERISRAYISAYCNFIGEDVDVPAPDLGTNSTIMDFMYSEYKRIKGGNPKAIITGKSVPLGGSKIRKSATGHGGYYVLETLFKNHQNILKLPPLREITLSIQGFGNVSSYFAEKCFKSGIKIVAISNKNGGIYNPKGINIIEAIRAQNATKEKEWGVEGEKITNEELLQISTDVLAPGAIEDVINKDNADKIKSRLILELANGPITIEADKILQDKNIIVIPDILANAGGVVSSYFEWKNNRNGEEEDAEKAEKELYNKMAVATHKVIEIQEEYKISSRIAAYVLASKRLSAAIECLGTSEYFKK